MAIYTLNKQILIGPVVAGGKIYPYGDGSSRATFRIYTDSWKGGGAGSKPERVVEYHYIQVKNTVYDDLYELIEEGNLVLIEGESRSYRDKADREVRYTSASKISIIRKAKEK
jgi:hypothetical protein